jgi:hypothetical protein
MAAKHFPYKYEITVQGELDERWAKWFEDLTISPTPSGETIISGVVADQSALHGILNRIRDLGLELISIQRKTLDERP